MIKKHPGRVHKYLYIFVLVLIFCVLSILGFLINRMFNQFYEDTMKSESEGIARQYVKNIQNAISASDIINELLDDKLGAVSRLVGEYDKPLTNEVLKNIADLYGVDEIYSYDKGVMVVSSARGNYIGWKPEANHPIMKFVESGKKSLIEDIRKDSVSGIPYKYAYYRRDDGSIVQIGILADVISDFIDNFQVENLIKEISRHEDIGYVFYMRSDFSIANGYKEADSITHLSGEEQRSLSNGQTLTRIVKTGSGNLFQTIVPIITDDSVNGYLAISHKVSTMDVLAQKIGLLIYLNLVVIGGITGLSFFAVYRRNKRLYFQASHDLLTGLPNKRYYDSIMDNRIKEGRKGISALMVADYRNLDFINSVYGYHSTESIIRDTSRRIYSLKKEHMEVFHIAYDRFAIFIMNETSTKEIDQIAEQCLDIMMDYAYSNYIGGNVGVYLLDSLDADANEILKFATIAANDAKTDVRFGVNYFDRDVEQAIRREEKIEFELQRILYNKGFSDEFYLEFQPVIDLQTGRVSGFEALARLNSVVLGRISPLEFITVAEKTNLIVPLGERIFYMAADFLKELYAKGYSDINVAVNVSGIQLLKADFIATVTRVIEETGIRPENLDLELTESVFASDFTYLNNILSKLKELKIDVYIDDFGTGYSSFQRGSDIEAVTLKIDKIFIDKVITDKDRSVVADIIAMAHKLGHRVVAEGVEEAGQLEYLKENQCDYIQGYIYSRPLPFDSALQYLETVNLSWKEEGL